MWISTLLTAILFFLMLLALELGYRADGGRRTLGRAGRQARVLFKHRSLGF
jgi:hypothetical protein